MGAFPSVDVIVVLLNRILPVHRIESRPLASLSRSLADKFSNRASTVFPSQNPTLNFWMVVPSAVLSNPNVVRDPLELIQAVPNAVFELNPSRFRLRSSILVCSLPRVVEHSPSSNRNPPKRSRTQTVDSRIRMIQSFVGKKGRGNVISFLALVDSLLPSDCRNVLASVSLPPPCRLSRNSSKFSCLAQDKLFMFLEPRVWYPQCVPLKKLA